MMGQTIRTKNLGTVAAGSAATAVINTSDLANGIYLYTIHANDGRISGRIVVSH